MEFVVNRNIQRILRDTGQRQGTVADRAGMNRKEFSDICRCKRKVYADEVLSLAAALQVSVEELLKDAERSGPRCENCEHWMPFYVRVGKAGSVISGHGLCRIDPAKEPHAIMDVCGEWQEDTGMKE